MIIELKTHFKQCEQCNKPMLILGYTGDICTECAEMNRTEGEIEHSRLIRCPRCRNKMSMYDLENIFADDVNSVTCIHCDYDFEIVTRIEYNFESPKVLK